MRFIKIKDIIDLIISGIPDGEARIQKIFEWHFDRVKTIAQLIFGAVAALSVWLIISFFRGELSGEPWQIGVAIAAVAGIASFAVYRMWQLRLLHRQFITALKLYCDLKKVRPFLTRYRQI